MLSPRLEACVFGTGAGDQWPRLARVLSYTAATHCPHWSVRIQRLQAPGAEPDAYADNTFKLDRWAEIVAEAPDGTPLLLTDVDTAILRPLDDVWTHPFDVAYTVKPARARLPLNAGVVFVRVSPQARAFVEAWRDRNQRFLLKPREHHEWRRKFGGINQAALGCVLASEVAAGLVVRRLPCAEWNCEDESWQAFDPSVTRILHVKSALRRAVFSLGPPPSALKPLIRRWRHLERAAIGESGAVAS